MSQPEAKHEGGKDPREELIDGLASGRRRFYDLPSELPADEQARVRREALQRLAGAEVEHSGRYSLDAETVSKRNCENFYGVTQIPTGVVGPLHVKGSCVNESVLVPLATTEGALLASVNRGCSAIRRAGGVSVQVDDIGMTRAPVFKTSGVEETRRLTTWVKENEERIREVAEGTSRFLRLVEIRAQSLGSTVWLRFRFTCGDAMGMNMVTIACDRVVRQLVEPETGVTCIALSGNFCVDKKPAAINWLEGRGKRLHAEIVLSKEVLAKVLKTDADALVEAQYRKNLLGSIAAGAQAYNAQVANVVAAYFIATGQDLAHVVEACLGATCIEKGEDGSVYASLTLPNVPLGAVGGGTSLACQREALAVLGVQADASVPGMAVTRLGEILAGVALAGELSLMSAFTSNDLASAHERLGRGDENAKTTGQIQQMKAPTPRPAMSGASIHPALVSVPGKLILAGEHAAVYGHPAMVAAIDMRLQVEAEPAPAGSVILDLPQLGYHGETNWDSILRYTEEARGTWMRSFEDLSGKSEYRLPGEGPGRLVQIAIGETLSQLGVSPRDGMHLRIDSHLPVGSGFGSSAAVGVGVATAVLSALGRDFDRDLIQKISFEVERRQHGTPSGVDNITVLDGGVLWAQRDDSGKLHYERMPVDSPLLNRFRVFNSGQPAEPTGELVAAVKRQLQKARESLWTILNRIGEATLEMRRLLTDKDCTESPRILVLLRQCEEWLEELGVVPKPVKRVIRRIEEMGGAAKISGAGALTGAGGGSIIVYHDDPDAISNWDFLAPWAPIPVRLGAEGVRVEKRD